MSIYKKYNIHIALIAIITFAATLLVYPGFFYILLDSCDFQGYTYNFFHFEKSKIIDYHYFNDRVAQIIPHYIFYNFFGDIKAKYFLYFLKLVLVGFSTWFYLRQVFKDNIALLFTAVVIPSSLITGAMSLDYPAILPLIYFGFSIGFRFSSEKSYWNEFYAGLFFMLALSANVKIVIFMLFIPFSYFLEFDHKDVLKKSIIFSIGMLVCVWFLGTLTYYISGEFLYFYDTLIKWDSDLVYAKVDPGIVFNTNSTTYLIESSNIPVLLIVLPIFLFSLILKSISIREKLLLISIAAPLIIYHFLGGSTIGFKTAIWIIPIFFLFIRHVDFEIKGKNIHIFYYIVFFLALLLNLVPTFYYPELLFELGSFFNVIFVLFGVILCLKIIPCYMKSFSVILFFALLKPSSANKAYFFSENMESKKKYQEVMRFHDELKTKFNNSNIGFFLNQEKDNFEKPYTYAARIHNGCIEGYALNGDHKNYLSNKGFEYILISKHQGQDNLKNDSNLIKSKYIKIKTTELIDNHYQVMKLK